MENNEKLADVSRLHDRIKHSVVESVNAFVKRTFGLSHAEIKLGAALADLPQSREMCTAVELKSYGSAFGVLVLEGPLDVALSVTGAAMIESIGRMLADQLDAIGLLDGVIGEYAGLVEENSRSRDEVDIAYADLNLAHEELSEAYSLGVLLNRSLSRLRQEVERFLEQAPIAFGILRHRRLRIELANSLILKLWGKDKDVIGKPLSIALPELAGQPYLDILDEVYTTGTRYVGRELPVILEIQGEQRTVYFNFIYEPLKNESNLTNAIMIIANDVTELVRNRIEESNS